MKEKKILSENEIKAKVEYLSSTRCNHTPHKYIDITGDLVAGTLLAQIMYWFAEGKNRVSIYKDGFYWIAKRREDWMAEIKITKKQYDCAIKKLTGEIEPTEEEKKQKWNKGKRREKKYDMENRLVEVKTYHFYGIPTTHIRPITENINRKVDEWKRTVEEEIRKENGNASSPNLQNGNLGNLSNSNLEISEEGKSYNNIYNNINTDTENTNRDCHSETTDKYALEDMKRLSSKGNMYASVPEEHKDVPPKKQSRYIPPDYTEEQLIEHIKPTIEENLKTVQEDCGMEYNPKCADDIVEIVIDFFEQYREKTGHRHKILPDATVINIMYQYFNPPECLWDRNDPPTYSAMIEKYLDANFNARGGYDGEVTLSISHFMSEKIRENCYHKSK